MDKNSVVAIVLIMIIIVGWQLLFRNQTAPQIQTPASQEQIQDTLGVATPSQPVVPARDESKPSAIESQKPRKRVVIQKEEIVKVENDLFRGLLSSRDGGSVISWKLKNYLGKDGKWVEMVTDTVGGNLSLAAGLNLDQSAFQVVYDTLGEEKIYRFVSHLDNGVSVEKIFKIIPGTYDVRMGVRFTGLDYGQIRERYSVQWRSGLLPTEKRINDDERYYQAYALQGGELLKTKEKSTGLREGSTDWIAMRTKYFLMALIPETQGRAAFLEGREVQIHYEDEAATQKWRWLTTRIEMAYNRQEVEESWFTLYMGPMDYQELKSHGVQLEKMMNFGWAIIKPFSILFYHVLQFIRGVVGNFGWAIIIFAIMIKIVLYPLTRKSFQSMRKMQALQPKINALKEKYKNDQQKMTQATMALYKEEGVNPMSGCLPMLLQMPVLFALFNLFRTTIMLRQAPFGLIKDLSAPDGIIALGSTSIHVIPILMGATMIIQQKLSMQDPKQKAMAYMMPIFFTFMFYRFSSGLNLYYLIFNLVTIAQELIVKKGKAKEE